MADLSTEETEAFDRARARGGISVALYRQGAFSEPDFIQFGVLERLVIRGLLSPLGRQGDQFNASYHYGLPPRSADRAAPPAQAAERQRAA